MSILPFISKEHIKKQISVNKWCDSKKNLPLLSFNHLQEKQCHLGSIAHDVEVTPLSMQSLEAIEICTYSISF